MVRASVSLGRWIVAYNLLSARNCGDGFLLGFLTNYSQKDLETERRITPKA